MTAKFVVLLGGVCSLFCFPLSGLGHDEALEGASKAIQEQDWRAANRSLKKAIKNLAKADDLDREKERKLMGRFAALSALVAAGKKDERLADWYWWVSTIYAEPDRDGLRSEFGPIADVLFSKVRRTEVRAPPEGRAPTRLVRQETSIRRYEGPPPLHSLACRKAMGWVSFDFTVGEKGQLWMPRRTPGMLLHQRPACTFFVLERLKGFKSDAPPGVRHRFEEELNGKSWE